MEIGQKIKKARLERGLTQQELGELVGVQKSAIAKYENGRVVNIKRSTLQKIAGALNIRPSELIFTEIEEKKNDILADIIIRMRTDEKFLTSVIALNDANPEKLEKINQMIQLL